MNTLIISDLSNMNEAARIIKQGGLVAAPTETVYGLAANALNPSAVAAIFKAKGRPSDNPLIVHIASLEALNNLVEEVPDDAKRLIDAFWPGPLTLIFRSKDIVPEITRAGLETVAIRFPSHPIMSALISASALPLAAPSANTSGKPSPTNAQRVIEDLAGKVDAIIDGGDCSFGLESTVVDTTSMPFTILRPGAITYDMIKEVIGEVFMDPALMNHTDTAASTIPKAPGMKYTHYSPNAEVVIVTGESNDVVSEIKKLYKKQTKLGKKVGILIADEFLDTFSDYFSISAGSMNNLSEIASNLFEVLRQFDDQQADIVYSVAFPNLGIGQAIMNRLEKSAGHTIIQAPKHG